MSALARALGGGPGGTRAAPDRHVQGNDGKRYTEMSADALMAHAGVRWQSN